MFQIIKFIKYAILCTIWWIMQHTSNKNVKNIEHLQ